METITLTIPESQIVEWVRQLSPKTKQAVLRVLIPELDEFESLVNYGGQQMRQRCAERGIDWEGLAEDERQELVDDWLHKNAPAKAFV